MNKDVMISTMLQRIFVHLSLILLFAFTQMGVATHEISHLTDRNQPHQQDKNSHESQCGQCLTYSHAATADVSPPYVFGVTPVVQVYTLGAFASSTLTTSSFYSARAPPSFSQV